MYKQLHLQKITDTLRLLEARISERFSDCGLLLVCQELGGLTAVSAERIAWILKPNLFIRLAVALVILVALISAVVGAHLIHLNESVPTVTEFVQVAEAFTNELVLIGASLFFLFSLETRIKRSRTLDALHELRAIAHVVDMHQLTKDPVMSVNLARNTASSPKRELDAFELRRYLDYCAEMLSLIGKTAALYSQQMPDPQIVAAANAVETLCANFSHKIWQKIMIIQAERPAS